MTGKIDYSTIGDKVVKQALEHMNFELNKEQVNQLVQDKLNRAQQLVEARTILQR